MPKEQLGKTTMIKTNAAKADQHKQAALSQTQAPQVSEKLAHKPPERNKGSLKIYEAKRGKIANEVYTEILEETLLQTRKLLIDEQDAMKMLKEEINWQVRNN